MAQTRILVLRTLVLFAAVFGAERLGAQVPDGTVLYQWVQVVTASVNDPSESFSPQMLVRAVVANAGGGNVCPSYSVGGTDRGAMHFRGNNADPKDFKVGVCEAVVAAGSSSVAVAGKGFGFFPVDTKGLGDRIYVLGDTGCRDNDDNPCSGPENPEDWGFPQVAQTVAAQGDPTLFLHMGDLLYRRLPTGSGCKVGKICDTWANWEADFFAPAAPLFAKAPWLIARGNHEICSSTEGGNGWFLLLDPHSRCLGSTQGTPACGDGPTPMCCSDDATPCDTNHRKHPIPYAADVGFDAGEHSLRILMLDSSGASDTDTSTDTKFVDRFQTINEDLAPGAAINWLVTHIPLSGVKSVDCSDPEKKIAVVAQELLAADSVEPLAANVGLVVAGHRHIFQTANVSESQGHHPAQLVVGNGGVNLSMGSSFGSGQDHCAYRGVSKKGQVYAGSVLTGWLYRRHGYMVLTPEEVFPPLFNWNGTLFDASGAKILECRVTASAVDETSNVSCRTP